ncbi:hypothetical protein FACS1894111_08240 [Clostridia bacterium]|nr:hypothetical protein FACS1894111_08240 [Clostridia bacterium]
MNYQHLLELREEVLEKRGSISEIVCEAPGKKQSTMGQIKEKLFPMQR